MQTQEKPLISVIVPVYNVAPYLPTCLDSILNQTYKNLEVILVASTSKDNSVEICDEYAGKDERISVIHCPPNGLSDGRNRGIDASHGEYLSFIDSDDFIAPEFIQTLYDIIVEYGCDIAQVNYYRVEEDDTNIIPDSKKEVEIYTGREMNINLARDIPNTSSVVAWSKLYQKELFADIRYPVGKISEDVATTHKLFHIANKVGMSRQKLYFWRKNPTSITGQEYYLKRLDDITLNEERMQFFLDAGDRDLYWRFYIKTARQIPPHRMYVKKYFPEETEIKQELRKKIKINLKTVLKCPLASSKDKGIILAYSILYEFPLVIRLLSKMRGFFVKIHLLGEW